MTERICSICRTLDCLQHTSVCTSCETCHGSTSTEHKLVHLVTPETDWNLFHFNKVITRFSRESMVWTQEYQQFMQCECLGESSSVKNCRWWLWRWLPIWLSKCQSLTTNSSFQNYSHPDNFTIWTSFQSTKLHCCWDMLMNKIYDTWNTKKYYKQSYP